MLDVGQGDGGTGVSEPLSVPVWREWTFPLRRPMKGKLGWWMEMLENSVWLYMLAQKLALLALRPLVYMQLSYLQSV